MTMTTHRFVGPSVTARRTGQCPTCGRKVTRSRTFERTVNPFNCKVVDGERIPKTWKEVRVDVQAEADAWSPLPDVFEHVRCRGARLAPPRAEFVDVSAERLAVANQVRSAMTTMVTFTAASGLPLSRVEFSRGAHTIIADVGSIPDGEVVMWARALGLTEVRVHDGNGHTDVRVHAELPSGVMIRGCASIANPEGRDRLGGAAVTWARGEQGRKTGVGTVGVDDLAEGLAVLGIAVVINSYPKIVGVSR